MKKLLAIMMTFTMVTPSVLTVSCKGNFKYTRDYLKNEEVNDGIKKDIEAKKDSNNVSVYLVKRNGAFIGVQSLLSSALMLNENPEKKVYYYNSQSIKPTDALGEETLHYDSFESNEIKNFSFGKTDDSLTYMDSNDLDEVIKKENIDGKSKKIDLYLEDFEIFDAVNGGETFPDAMLKYAKYINSITFTTDGIAHYKFSRDSQS